MEERAPPAAATHHHHDTEDPDYYDITAGNYDDDDNNDSSGGQTYIVQIPKDQIYRVPPPEHAEIVQRYRSPATEKGRRRPRCMCWCLSVFVTLALLITVISCVVHFTLSPNPPTFSVKHLVVVAHPKKHGGGAPGFRVTVGTRNPNSNNNVGYERGSATLEYKEKVIADGDFPALDDVGPGKSDTVDVVLEGSGRKGGLPEKHKSPVSFVLKMDVPVKLKTWLMTKEKEVRVECEFEVNSLGDHVKVVSQSCVNQD